MEITKNQNGGTLEVAVQGRVDTTTAPQLQEELADLAGVSELVLDLAGLDYISSAGLRVLLSAQKAMNKQGTMVVRNVNDTINEIFDVTGFTEILTLE